MSTGIIACGAIATHISNIASRENFDLTIYPLPPLLHNHPEQIAGEVDAKIQEIKGKHSKIAVAYSDCGTYGAIDKVIKVSHSNFRMFTFDFLNFCINFASNFFWVIV